MCYALLKPTHAPDVSERLCISKNSRANQMSRTENIFIARTVSSIDISLNGAGLKRLQQIARSSKYSNLVETICVVPSDTAWSFEEASFRNEGMAKWTGNLFTHLENLKSVQIGRFQEEDQRICASRWERSYLSEGFEVLLNALNTSGKQLEKIGAGFQSYGKGNRNSIDHMVLQLPANIQLNTSLSCLKQLDLVLEIRSRTTSVHCETYLADLLKQTVNLERLSLSFPDTHCVWPAALPDVYLPSLTSLTLTKARQVCATELYQFIARHKTIRSLKLTLLQFNERDPFKGLAECLQDLKLKEIHFQQLTHLHHYSRLMLFGGDTTKICHACYQDVEAAFLYNDGPGCEHATLSMKNEHEIFLTLQSRLRNCHLLERLH